ncbi:MAG TPA: hypothetical protein VJ785_15755 [Anaerolineales bacterium]|nr:hypothetical protein [Anaerolineales bacterium]
MNPLRSRSILLVVLAVSLSLAVRKAAAAQEASSLPGQFAYVDSGTRLFLVRGNVDEPILLVQTTQGTSVGYPHFSRDGRYLAYCTYQPLTEAYPTLYYLDTLTLEKVLVTNDGSCAYDWSPDGGTLIFSTPAFLGTERTVADGIWSYSRETGSLQLLIPTDSPIIDPRWSPDGKMLSYFDFCFECGGQFYTYDLTSGMTKEWSQEGTDEYIGPNVDWSPDGSSLVYDKEIPIYAAPGETYGLYLASSDDQTRDEIYSQPGRGAFYPIWSADGKRIAFASFESFTIGNFLNRRADLITVAPDGPYEQKLYSSIYELFPQAWSPDSRYLLFVEPLSASQGSIQNQQLVLLDVESGNWLWTTSSSEFITADWAPLPDASDIGASTEPTAQMAGKDGLLFVSPDYALAFYDPLTGQAQKLTASFSGTQLSVSPDGQTILFGDQIVTIQSQADGTVSASVIESPHPQFFYNINWSPDGQKYGFVNEDDTAWVGELSGARMQLPDGEFPPDWSFDGRWMAYCDKEGRLWIAETGKPADWIIQQDRCYIEWSPTQSILAYTTHPPLDFENRADGTAFLYDPISGRTREVAQAISGLEWSVDGKLMSIGRITTVGASNYSYTITVINLETGAELLMDEYHAEMYGSTDWIEQADGYLFGRYRFQADLLTKEAVADSLFDARRDGSRLLIGSGTSENIEIGCRNGSANVYSPLLTVTLSDTPGAAMPGLEAQFSPDGEWVRISDFVEDKTVNWLARCATAAPVQLAGNAGLSNQYFSPDSAWLVMEQTHSFEEQASKISLQELASGTVKEVQAGLNTSSAWFRMPEPPIVPLEEVQPTESVAASSKSGPIDLQSATPSTNGILRLLPLLLWAIALIGVVLAAYFLWMRSVAAHPQQTPVAQEAVQMEAVPQTSPASKLSAEEVEDAYREGVELVRAGKAAEGIAELQQVVSATADNEDAWFWLAIANVKQKSYRTAERCFLQAKKHGHPEADKALEWLRRQVS